MNRFVALFVVFTISCFVHHAETADEPQPIRALLVTGGCCHDYARQKLILTKGISARANVVWTVAHQGGSGTSVKIPLYENPDWAKGFDIVVHNECFAGIRDKAWVDRILKPHREGTPAILIHCAMHCYRTGDDQWFEFVGMQSPGHGPHYSFTVKNKKPDHPIMQGFGEKFLAPKGELYHSVRLFDTATALAEANRRGDNKPQTCIWTNEYNKKARVFCTTVGHYNETMTEPKYLDLITRGVLWATKRDQSEFRKTDEKTDEAIRSLVSTKVATGGPAKRAGGKCCNQGNLAFEKAVKASSEEKNKKNFAKNAIDGDLNTRWCSQGNAPGSTWEVDLGKADHIKSLRIHWEKQNDIYTYKVDASADAKEWKTIVDKSKNDKVEPVAAHNVDAPDTRYLRVTFLGTKKHKYWGSFWEFEAYADKLPPLPKSAKRTQGGPVPTLADVKAPDGFQVTMFGAPPQVNYPVCITAAPTGEVFVGVDEQGSLGKQPGGGKVLRCIDIDGDGQADKVNEFAKIEHPRGLIYDNGSLWVLHPPFLSVHHDDDLDGVSDRSETLLTGISTDEINKRGWDHTTNGIRMGIDGWIYIAVGDFGFTEAKGTDGTTLARRGGGVVRVRPDGKEMEVYCWGLRNILDVCIDPFMNIFTRDNTNDGGGWDIRFSHIMQSANYGYPSLYLNFSDEIMPPLADYGGGSGCGGMYLHDLRWPKEFGNTVYTCDWGRSEVYRHNPPANGATFDADQDVFLKIPRPTDIDVDGGGLMYVSSWKNGKFAYSGPNVGFVAQVRPIDYTPTPFPNLAKATDAELIQYLASPSAVYRLHSQRELLRRGQDADRWTGLTDLYGDAKVPMHGRVAALFTLKQMYGVESHGALLKASEDNSLREFAFRALTDRKTELEGLDIGRFTATLKDESPRVRAQTLISLGRLGNPNAGEAILPLTKRAADSKPVESYKQPDPDRVIPHLAVQSLVRSGGYDAALKGTSGPNSHGAFWALKSMHDPKAVDGLIAILNKTRNVEKRQTLLAALIRLYHKEGDYKGGWWGTRPDRTGPYFDRQPWAASPRIASTIKTAVSEADARTVEFVKLQLDRHKVKIDGIEALKVATKVDKQAPIQIPKIDKNNPGQIANLAYEAAAERALKTSGDAAKGKALFTRQSCIACHTYANGQLPKGPHLVDIGKRYKRHELIESILKPSAKIAQGFDTYAFQTLQGQRITGFVVSESATSVTLRKTDGTAVEINRDDIDVRSKQKQSMMPVGLVQNLTPEQLSDLLAYLESLKSQ
ncbi:MAG: heme-binding domain-containing protein [Planctomycetaceae bacterium]|nr:heme-binding domain-containing protein [Planctomycetaceae bacterium]